MTVRFMVLSAPRSASTWASNWLTTERTLCLHDPVIQFEPEELDHLPCDRALGFACTGMAHYREWIRAHPARKVIIHRNREEIDESLLSIGLTPLRSSWDGLLEDIHGMHVNWRNLFDPLTAGDIYTYLTGLPFDAARHALLVDMNIQPQFDRVHVKANAAKAFAQRVRQALAS